jgi:hypothetical protein
VSHRARCGCSDDTPSRSPTEPGAPGAGRRCAAASRESAGWAPAGSGDRARGRSCTRLFRSGTVLVLQPASSSTAAHNARSHHPRQPNQRNLSWDIVDGITANLTPVAPQSPLSDSYGYPRALPLGAYWIVSIPGGQLALQVVRSRPTCPCHEVFALWMRVHQPSGHSRALAATLHTTTERPGQLLTRDDPSHRRARSIVDPHSAGHDEAGHLRLRDGTLYMP